jgi:hypothetical protein
LINFNHVNSGIQSDPYAPFFANPFFIGQSVQKLFAKCSGVTVHSIAKMPINNGGSHTPRTHSNYFSRLTRLVFMRRPTSSRYGDREIKEISTLEGLNVFG